MLINEDSLAREFCAYSFADLYLAAHGAPPTQQELNDLYSLSQDERNAVVRRWANAAGWVTEDVRGANGIVYASFGPQRENLCRER